MIGVRVLHGQSVSAPQNFCADDRLSVDDLIQRVLPNSTEAEQSRFRVTLARGDEVAVIERSQWPRVYPSARTELVIMVVPGIGAVATQLAVWASVGGASTLVANAVGIAGGLLALGATAALARALIPAPPRRPEQLRDPGDAYALDGWQNQIRAGEPIPFPVGRIRMAPLLIAAPHSEVVGDELYQRAGFVFGHGPMELSDFKTGDSAFDALADAQLETRQGYPGDPALSLVAEQVFEDVLNRELTHKPDGSDTLQYVHALPAQCHRATVIVFFPQGLVYTDDEGNSTASALNIRIETRQIGAAGWTVFADIVVNAASIDPFWRSFAVPVSSAGQVELRIWRVTAEADDFRRREQVTLYAVQGVRDRYPVAYNQTPLTLAAVRVKASQVAQGRLDAFNAIAERRLPDWNGTTWVPNQTSRNPASIFRAVLLSGAGAEPVAEADLLDDEITAWHAFCAAKGLRFDKVFYGGETLGDVLTAICAAGRATWRRDGEGWGVVVDRPQPAIVDRISPRNASEFRWTRRYFEPPEGFRIPFRDQTNGYELAERVVPWPGHSGDINLAEELPQGGVTDPAQIWFAARRRMFELQFRPETFVCIQGGAFRTARRGDAVDLSWDVLDVAQCSARVILVRGDEVTLDEPVTIAPDMAYGLRWQVFDETDTVGYAAEAQVQAAPGSTNRLLITPGGALPREGAMVHFGPLTRINFACRVVRVEPADDFTFRLTLTNDAPEIDTLTDAEVPPAWDRMAGPVNNNTGSPQAPVLGAARVAATPRDFAVSETVTVTIPVSMPAGDIVPVGRITVFHRLSGAGAWQQAAVPGASGEISIETARNAQIETYAHAESVFGIIGPDSTTLAITAYAASAALPAALDLQGIQVSALPGAARLSVATQSDTAALQLFRAPAGSALDIETHLIGGAQPAQPNSTAVLVDGDATRTDLILNSGFDSADGWAAAGGWTIAGGAATHSGGLASTLSQALALVSGRSYRIRMILSGVSAGNVTLQFSGTDPSAGVTRAEDGTWDVTLTAANHDRIEILASPDFDGQVLELALFEDSETTVPQGAWDYYVAPLSAAQIANAPVGPVPATIY